MTNLFGLKGQLDVMGQKHHKNWLRDTVSATAAGELPPPPKSLWFAFNDSGEIFLTDLYTYTTPDGVYDAFKIKLTKAVKRTK